MTSRLTVAAVLDEAERHLDEFDPRTSGTWPHAAAVLIRQSLESTLNGFWINRAPGMQETSWRDRWQCLPAYLGDRPEARAADFAWTALSQACHHRAYEVGLTQDELRAPPGHRACFPGDRAGGAGMTQPIALVLAGGGARGAYEAGVLSVLLPALPQDERPNLIVGASVGAVNGAYLAATPRRPRPHGRAQRCGRRSRWGDVLATPSIRDLDRIARAALTFTGLLSLDVPALLDATPLEHTLERLIPFEEIGRHVDEGRLISAAVVATSALTGRSVVFHQGGTPDEVRDDKRGIDYVPTVLNEQHVRASSAIPAAFPAVEVTDGSRRGLVLRRRHPPERADQAGAVAGRRARDRRRAELDRARAPTRSPARSARTSSPAPRT